MTASRALTKSELIVRLAARNPRLAARDADEAVKLILDMLGASLAQGGRIEIRGFGSFSLNYRPARVGRNPKSGERVEVPAKHVPHFKAGKELRERVDGNGAGGPEAASVHQAKGSPPASTGAEE
jgi:integration host factor subunit beta